MENFLLLVLNEQEQSFEKFIYINSNVSYSITDSRQKNPNTLWRYINPKKTKNEIPKDIDDLKTTRSLPIIGRAFQESKRY